MKLSEELKHWRIERPDEWKMDDFIRKAQELEEEVDRLEGVEDELREAIDNYYYGK
jgi:exonuclease VII small subunit